MRMCAASHPLTPFQVLGLSHSPVSASVLQGAVQPPDISCGQKANLDLCLQRIPMHGSAVGTATPKQPKRSEIHGFNKYALRFLLSYFHK